jgi:hypothetical protein
MSFFATLLVAAYRAFVSRLCRVPGTSQESMTTNAFRSVPEGLKWLFIGIWALSAGANANCQDAVAVSSLGKWDFGQSRLVVCG